MVRLPLCDPTLVTVTVTAPALARRSRGRDGRAVHHNHIGAAAVLPNVTVAPAAKFVPVIVTAVPPDVDPLFGTDTGHRRGHNVGESTRQASAQAIAVGYRHRHRTRTTRRSRGRDGRAVHHHHIGRCRPAKRHRGPEAKFVPVIVTAVPPAAGPLLGDTLLTVGGAT